MDLTEEQLAVADAQVGVNSWFKIVARAGTGKTSSFIAYAHRNVVPTLYLAFNKSVEESAQGKFPSHVKCKTVHALAWGAVGRRYPKLINNVRYYEVQKLYRLDVYASTLVCKTLDNFLNSADPQMTVRHAEEDHRKKFKTDIRGTLVECANDLWARMCAGDQEKFQMTHSGYLKLYQLSKPRLFEKTIMLDEGQDTNQVTFDIVEQQRKLGARILICGDPYQAIYSWRGAKNALDFVQDTETVFLTQSFRFGEQVARVANSILTSFFHEEVLVQGHPLLYDEIVNEFPDSEPITVITRTNAEIFDQAASWTGLGKSVHFIGEAKFNILVDGVMDVYHMFMNTRGAIRDKTIAFHRDFACLKLFAEERMDNELLSKITIVEKHKVGVPRLIEQIKKLTVPEPMANIVLVTAHKSKGLEWDNVYLTNDYFELFSKETGGLKLLREEVEAKIAAGHYDHGDDDYDNYQQERPDWQTERLQQSGPDPKARREWRCRKALFDSIHRDEVNLLYVAATRAKKRLRINSELHRLMSYAAARSVQPPVPKLAPPPKPPVAPTRKPIPNATSSSLLPPRKLRPAPPASILDGLEEEVEHSKRYGRPEEI